MKDIIKLTKISKKPLIMGVLNITPDSFSDGGQHNSISKAIKRVQEMEREGADIIDIGGESTGPNSPDVSLEEELSRVLPVLEAILKVTKLPISIDTYKASMARQALEMGASIINDVTALRGDKDMAAVAKQFKCPIILMYSKDNSARTTIKNIHYKNIIQTLKLFFKKQIGYAKKQGLKKSQIVIDPGMGNFISKNPKPSLETIARLKELKKLTYPICIGSSRKSFLGGEMSERDTKGQVISAIAYLNGASIIRTHDVKGTKNILEKL